MNKDKLKKFKTIGVLGGMGPFASAYFYQLMLKKLQREGAIQDSDYPHLVINSIPLIGSTEFGMEDNDLIVGQLIKGVDGLEKAGVDFTVIACNSVHNAIQQLRQASKVPILSIIEEVTNTIAENQSEKVLVLSSETTQKYELYNELCDKGIEIIRPKEKLQSEVTNLILSVMGGLDFSKSKTKIIKSIKNMYLNNDIDSIILGCTELPLAIQQHDLPIKIYDSLDILAGATLKFARNDQKQYPNKVEVNNPNP